MNGLILALLLIVPFTSQGATTYASKLTIRSSSGILDNQGTSGGRTSTLGGFNLVYTHFLTEKLSAGGGYRAHFDLTNKTMPVWGWDISGRYYYWGKGTRVRTTNPWLESESHDRWAFYTGFDYSKREYFFGDDPLGTSKKDQMKGDYSTGNITVGADHRMDSRFELNTELLYSFLTFAASDPRVQIQSTLFSIGLTYLF